MRRVYAMGLLGLLCILFANHPALASVSVRSSAQAGSGELPRIEVIEQSGDGLSLAFELPVLVMDQIPMAGREFQSVEIPGGAIIGDTGKPGLPTFGRLIAVPAGARTTITAVVEDEEEIAGVHLLPVLPDEGEGFVYDEAAYSRAGYGDEPQVTIGEPAIARDARVVPINFRPVRYDAAARSMKVASRIRVEVRFDGHDDRNVKVSDRSTVPPSFDRLYQAMIVNYDQSDVAQKPVVPGTYLLICADDAGVINRLQPLIQWHTRKGMTVQLATMTQTGSTKESIKNYIQNAYNSANPPLEYVAIAGDGSGSYSVPTWNEGLSGYNGEGDYDYTRLDGNDVLSDIHIGRLSFSNYTELEVIVNKVVGYESTPYIAQDQTWFKRACLVGDPNQSGYSCVQVQQWIKHRLRQLAYAEIDTIYSGNFVSSMATALNKGDTVFSYRGYYQMSGWGNSNTYALTNGWKMPFVVTITCDTGSFQYATSRSEGFLRANGGANNPKGGLAAIGTSTTGTHTRFNNCMHYGIMYGLLYEGQYTLGAALTRGRYELFVNYQDVDPNRVIVWSTWNNLMGDPGVACFTGYPEPLTVTYPASVAIGTNAVTVTVLENGQPAADAQVCLWKGSESYTVGLTDAQGNIELPVSTPTAGNMLVTVTKHDRYPHQGTIVVAGQQRFVGFQASAVDDDAVGESAGNGDGIVNPSESVELDVQLKNFGQQAAASVTATLATEDPYVTVTDGAETFGNINAGASAWSADDFDFDVSPACPHGHVIRFALDVSSGSDVWHSLIDVPVVAADLVTDGYTVQNAGANGRLDPGETVQLIVKLKNLGGAAAGSPTAVLVTQSEYIDVPEAGGSYGTIPTGGSAENSSDTFTIHAKPQCPQGYVGNMRLLIEYGAGLADTTDFTVTVGQRATVDPTGPDRYGYWAYEETDTAYPEAPVYNWIELDPAYGGSGATEIVLGDNGDYQDKSVVVTMPFPFQYYGKVYTKATICSNGWIAMGSQWNTEYRNWAIPGAGGPQAMIAPFWDDLYQQGGGKVYQRYDAANHEWIIEWSRLKNIYNGATEVFEVILRDPAFHTTQTGDGEILFQFHTVSNPDGTDGRATVGIENELQDDGVEITFFNLYTPGSTTLAANRAIRFVPKREVLSGLIRGTVSNASAGGIPIQGAKVTVLENGHEYNASATGAYEANELPGTYTLRASHPSFEPDTVGGVVVTAGNTQVVDFALRDIVAPVIATIPYGTTNDTLGPYTITATITDASPLTSTMLYYRTNGGAFTPVNMINAGANNYRASIPGQSWTTKVEYYLFAEDTAALTATDPEGAPDVLYTFYVAPTVTVFGDDIELDRGWSAGDPDDDAVTGRWQRVDPNATYYYADQVQPEDDHTVAPGTTCWITGNSDPGAGQSANDVDGGKTTLTSPVLFPALDGIVTLSYYRWFSNDTGTSPGEDEWVAQISDDDGASWIDLERTAVSERVWKRMEFNLNDLGIDLSGVVRIRFIASDTRGASVVEAGVDDVEVRLTGQFTTDVAGTEPTTFDLTQSRPNPFRTETVIRYALDRPVASARIAVYDIQGRVVRILLDGAAAAGSHAVAWDGRDAHGNAVSSGMYLYRFEADGRTITRKMVLLD